MIIGVDGSAENDPIRFDFDVLRRRFRNDSAVGLVAARLRVAAFFFTTFFFVDDLERGIGLDDKRKPSEIKGKVYRAFLINFL